MVGVRIARVAALALALLPYAPCVQAKGLRGTFRSHHASPEVARRLADTPTPAPTIKCDMDYDNLDDTVSSKGAWFILPRTTNQRMDTLPTPHPRRLRMSSRQTLCKHPCRTTGETRV